jgi:RsiW-degrading membrane proteinase PrsW (M82 family)
MENSQSTTVPLHHPGTLEMSSFFVQGLIVSVAISVFLETLARDYVAVTIPGDIGYIILVTVFAPVIEEFTKIFPLLNRHAETEKSIVKLGFLSGLGFGLAEFLVYVVYFSAPIAVRLPEMFFHAANTSLVAYGVAKHKFMMYYGLAVFFHFANNALTFAGDIWFIGGLGIIALVYYLAYDVYSKSSDSFLE